MSDDKGGKPPVDQKGQKLDEKGQPIPDKGGYEKK